MIYPSFQQINDWKKCMKYFLCIQLKYKHFYHFNNIIGTKTTLTFIKKLPASRYYRVLTTKIYSPTELRIFFDLNTIFKKIFAKQITIHLYVNIFFKYSMNNIILDFVYLKRFSMARVLNFITLSIWMEIVYKTIINHQQHYTRSVQKVTEL